MVDQKNTGVEHAKTSDSARIEIQKKAQQFSNTSTGENADRNPIYVTIDGKKYEADRGVKILNFCREVGIEIPTLCHMKDYSDLGSCRLWRRFFPKICSQRKVRILRSFWAGSGQRKMLQRPLRKQLLLKLRRFRK